MTENLSSASTFVALYMHSVMQVSMSSTSTITIIFTTGFCRVAFLRLLRWHPRKTLITFYISFSSVNRKFFTKLAKRNYHIHLFHSRSFKDPIVSGSTLKNEKIYISLLYLGSLPSFTTRLACLRRIQPSMVKQ